MDAFILLTYTSSYIDKIILSYARISGVHQQYRTTRCICLQTLHRAAVDLERVASKADAPPNAPNVPPTVVLRGQRTSGRHMPVPALGVISALAS
jgi:hypothetical protein